MDELFSNFAASRHAHPRLSVAGLVFDMGDVLYDATLWRRWLLQLLSRMGVQTCYRTLFKVWDIDYLDAMHRGEREYHEAFRSFLLSAGLTPGLVDEIEAASHARKRELELSTRPLPGVRATLGRLHSAGLSLGVLTDSESTAPRVRERLSQLGIADHWSAVVSSRDLGETKPHAACYRAALEAMGLPPARVAFVGHDAEELQGAADVGMPTIAFNYEPGVAADIYVERFDELLKICSPTSQLSPFLAA
jgi:HAD superfamily hydrolase (TIGR01509 family)